MKSFWPEFFYYTRTERRGILVLAMIVILFLVLPRLYPYWVAEPQSDYEETIVEAEEEAVDSSVQLLPETTLFDFDPNLASKEDFMRLGLSPKVSQTIINYRNKGGTFRKKEDLGKIYSLSDEDYERLLPYVQLKSSKKEAQKPSTPKTERVGADTEPFPFDPNTAIEMELRELGLSSKVIQTMMNYRKKGGWFRHKEDLKKIYGLSEEIYQRLEPYIMIEPQRAKAENQPLAGLNNESLPTSYEPTLAPPIKIDVNRASIEEWQQLRGIGPGYSKRIVNFRNKLGGFYSLEQIAETYGLPDSTFQQIKSQLFLSSILTKISINHASVEELKAHPYLKWKQAEVIVSYREQHGPFQSIEDLQKVKILSAELIGKLQPYLNFE